MNKKFDLGDKSRCTENLRLMCNDLGENIDSPLCQEVRDHIQTCANCRAYVDTVRKTVFFYKVTDKKEKVPDDVHERLWKILKLRK
jgi:predicted anti-sigma-YlaC factor YlaD